MIAEASLSGYFFVMADGEHGWLAEAYHFFKSSNSSFYEYLGLNAQALKDSAQTMFRD